MKGLFLYGINCTCDIWSKVLKYFLDIEIDYVEYPHTITKSASCITDITKWVSDTFGNSHYDFVVGHSMGGIIALELAVKLGLSCHQIILIDTNLKPANEFYRNLLTPEHMKEYGNKIIQKMQEEDQYYQKNLKNLLQNDFDYSGYVNVAVQDIYAIYGDRGYKEYNKRISDLCLEQDIVDKINFLFIENACHMPMVENPRALARMISDIINHKK